MKIKYVDLFAGIGGFRVAADQLKDEGYQLEAVASAEIDLNCRKLYSSTFHQNSIEETYINDVNLITEALLEKQSKNRWMLPDFDLLFAGFPCQPFSNVGQRAGVDDPRGMHFFGLLNILKAYKPKYFIFENVQKLSTIRKGELLQEFRTSLHDCGYNVCLWDLRADDYGLPQQRRRLFFCGIRSESPQIEFDLAPPPTIDKGLWQYPSVWHLLEKEMSTKHIIPDGTKKTVLRKNPKWAGDLFVNRPIARPVTATMHKWHRANQDNYYTNTYIFSDNPKENELLEPDKVGDTPIRRITPLEGFRLQGFPDSFASRAESLNLSIASQYKMIGNAVPVNLAKSVIRHFLNYG